MHLNVSDLDKALAFYEGVLGFQVALRAGASPVVLTADGRHHHIVLHAGRESAGKLEGTFRFSLRYPDRRALSGVYRRLTDAGVPIDSALDAGVGEALAVTDPDGHQIELYVEGRTVDPARAPAEALLPSASPLDLEAVRAEAAAPDAPAERALAPGGQAPLAELTRARLREMRVRLLTLHKVLLDDARAAYEMDRGHVRSTANLLQLVINDPWFAWLHPLSELVVRIDEVLQPDAPATEADSEILLDQVARLLTPGDAPGPFSERYYEALQRQPAVIMAHAEVRRLLKDVR